MTDVLINVRGKDEGASGVLGHIGQGLANLGSAAGGVGGPLGALGGALGNVGQIAGGILSAQLFTKIGESIIGFGKSAIDAVGHSQLMEQALEGLFTQSLMYQQVNEVKTDYIQLTGKEVDQLANLQQAIVDEGLDRTKLAAQIQEQQQRVIDLTAAYGESGLNVQTAKARLAEMNEEYNKSGRAVSDLEGQIAELSGKQGQLATTTERSWQQTMEFGEANILAKAKAAELLGFIEKLAITSPFERDQVEEVARLGAAAGMSVEDIKDFTAAFLDNATVMGISSAELGFAADQFLQLKKTGKLTEIDLRQLRRIGIDLGRVLGVEMGMSVDEFNKQVEKSPELMDELFASFIRMTEESAQGAASAASTTIPAILSNVHDLMQSAGKNLFRPVLETIGPVMADVLGVMAEFVTGGELAAIGERLGEAVSGGLKTAIETGKELFAAFQEGGTGGLLEALGLGPGTVDIIMSVGDTVMGFFDRIKNGFSSGGLVGGVMAASPLLALLGVSDEQIAEMSGKINEAIAQVFGFVQEAIEGYQEGGTVGLLEAIGLNEEQIAGLMETGEQIKQAIDGITAKVQEAIAGFQTGGTGGLLSALGFNEEQVTGITSVMSRIGVSFGEFLVTLEPLKASWSDFMARVEPALPGLQQLGEFLGKTLLMSVIALGDTFATILPFIGETLAGVGGLIMEGLSGAIDFFSGLGDLIMGAIEGNEGQMLAGIDRMMTGAVTVMIAPFEALGNLIGNLIDRIWPGQRDRVTRGAKQVLGAFENATAEWAEAVFSVSWLDLGKDIMIGLGEGITKNAHLVLEKLKEILGNFIDQAKATLFSSSPSKVFIEIGMSTMEGMAIGVVTAGADAISAVTGTLGQVITAAQATTEDMAQVGADLANAMIDGLAHVAITPGVLDDIAEGLDVVGFLNKINLEVGQGTAMGDEQVQNFFKNQFLAPMLTEISAFGLEAGAHVDELKAKFFELVATTGSAELAPITQMFAEDALAAEGFLENIIAQYMQIAELTRLANLGNILDIGQGFASFGAAIVGRLQEQADAMKEVLGLTGEDAERNQSDIARAQDGIEKTTERISDEEEKRRKLAEEIQAQQQTIAALTLEYGANSAEVQDAQDEMDDLRERYDDAGKAIDDLKKKMAGLNDELADTQAEGAAGLAGALRTAQDEFKELSGVDVSNKSLVDLYKLLHFGPALTDAQRAALEAVIAAQDTYNQELFEQQERERQIAEFQQKQADLAFLRQQLDFLQFISEHGLDAAEILGGMTLGLDADLDALLAAMSAAIAEVIGQVNDDLDIHSPSGIMFTKGRQIMEGLVGGIEAGQSMVQGAISAVSSALVPGAPSAGTPVQMNGGETHYHLHIASSAKTENLPADFNLMKAALGARS